MTRDKLLLPLLEIAQGTGLSAIHTAIPESCARGIGLNGYWSPSP